MKLLTLVTPATMLLLLPADAALDVETGTFSTTPDISPDASRIAAVNDGTSGLTMCAAPSVDPSTTVYYGPCLRSGGYTTGATALPVGFVKQTLKGFRLLKGNASNYLDGGPRTGTGTAQTTGSALRGITTASPITRASFITTATDADTDDDDDDGSSGEDSRYIFGRIAPGTCTSADYVYASGSMSVGDATVAAAVLGIEGEVAGACAYDQYAYMGTGTYVYVHCTR